MKYLSGPWYCTYNRCSCINDDPGVTDLCTHHLKILVEGIKRMHRNGVVLKGYPDLEEILRNMKKSEIRRIIREEVDLGEWRSYAWSHRIRDDSIPVIPRNKNMKNKRIIVAIL